jgi:error-prone DNA polymerase
MIAETRFAEIGLRSNFSFLEGASHPEEYAVAAKRLGLSGIGVADRNTVAGTVRVHLAAKEAKIPYHPGARLVFADETPDILAYPVDRDAWGRLCRLLSAGNLRANSKGTCELYEADLMEWGEGLMLAVMARPQRDAERLPALLGRLKARFGNHIHLALVPRYDGHDRRTLDLFAAIAAEAGVAILATNDVIMHEARACSRPHAPEYAPGWRLRHRPSTAAPPHA